MTVATAPFGGERSRTEEGTRPGESERGSRRLRGIAGGVQGDDGAARQGAACRAKRARAPGTRPVRLAGGGRRLACRLPAGLGLNYSAGPRGGRQVRTW